MTTYDRDSEANSRISEAGIRQGSRQAAARSVVAMHGVPVEPPTCEICAAGGFLYRCVLTHQGDVVGSMDVCWRCMRSLRSRRVS